MLVLDRQHVLLGLHLLGLLHVAFGNGAAEGRGQLGVLDVLHGRMQRRLGILVLALLLVEIGAGDEPVLDQLLGALEIGLGPVVGRLPILERDLVIGGIELDQHLSLLDQIALAHVDRLHGSGNAKCQLGLARGIDSAGELALAARLRAADDDALDRARPVDNLGRLSL